jgi:hypothetical protein
LHQLRPPLYHLDVRIGNIFRFANVGFQVEQFTIPAAMKDELPRSLTNGKAARRLMNCCLTNRLCRRAKKTRQDADAIFRSIVR